MLSGDHDNAWRSKDLGELDVNVDELRNTHERLNLGNNYRGVAAARYAGGPLVLDL